MIRDILRYSSKTRRTFQVARLGLLLRLVKEGYHWNVYRSPLLPSYVIKELKDTGYSDRKRFSPSHRLRAVAIGYAEPVIDLSPEREDFKVVLQRYYKDSNLGSLIGNACDNDDGSTLEMLLDGFVRQSRLLWSNKLVDFDAKFTNFVYGKGFPAPISVDEDLIGPAAPVFRTDFFRFVKYFFASNILELGRHSGVFLDRIDEIPYLRPLAAIRWGTEACQAFVRLPVEVWQRDLPAKTLSTLESIFNEIETGWAGGIC